MRGSREVRERERETERIIGSRRAGHLVGWRNTFSEGIEESILSEAKAEEEVTPLLSLPLS